ncbi:MAG: endonuclease/exonuclease/phosphatase family protein [Actinobacteria bacterium]|nr:endonuclease/exonuclease/phosphatase family protein [Actinomycetota bacterium]
MDGGAGEGTAGERHGGRGLRVVSWNIRDLLGDPLAVHRVLRALEPDVACLQEVPRRPGSRWQASTLARATGLLYVAGGRDSGGTALLVSLRTEVGRARAVRLPVGGRTSRTRGAVVAEVGLPGTGRVAVASVHLSLDADERLRHCASGVDLLGRTGRPPVVCGDLNERPDGPAWRAWGDDVRDPAPGAPPTFPAKGPRSRLDAVLVGSGVEVLGYGDGGADPVDVRAASDHVPVVAVLGLPVRG